VARAQRSLGVDGAACRGAVSGSPVPFTPCGPAHLGALAVVLVLAITLVAVVRAWPRLALPVRLTLAVAIVALVAFELTVGVLEGWLGWRGFLPLELCDVALVLAVITLVFPRRRTAELVYFWACSGSLVAMLTPELPWSFPRWEFVVFFGLHGLVLVSALVLVFALRLHPRPGAPCRVAAVTLVWTAFVALVDWVLDANFMYLRSKPTVATPLDWMGPWPAYIGVAAGEGRCRCRKGQGGRFFSAAGC
jgi:hypothetical integral membrane protein (TIGR02206 family)